MSLCVCYCLCVCEGAGVDPMMSMLALSCQRRDLSTVELLLLHGACDADLSIMVSAVASDDTQVIGVLLSRQHAYADTKFGVNKAVLLSVQSRHAEEPRTSSQSVSSLPAIMIDWRALKLRRLMESWLSQACLAYLRMSLASSMPSWLLLLNKSAYLITRIDVSENHLTSLPSMLFSLPSLRILIAAGNQVSVRCRAMVFCILIVVYWC